MKKIISLLLITVIMLGAITVNAKINNEEQIIGLLGKLNIMSGDGDGNLRLDSTLTRAEFTKITIASSAFRNSVASNITVSPFKDVKYTHWAAPYIKLAVTNKYVSGYPDGTFMPESPVLYEEAVTMVLKLLGYTDDDFGSSWPYGQVSLGVNLEINKNIDSGIGSYITRREAMNLVYNLLNTKIKNTESYYITTLNYAINDDIMLIATANEDSAIGSGKLRTTGSPADIKIDETFDYSMVGKKGTLITKNNDEYVSFIPNEQIINNYNVYQILNNDIIVLDNSELKTLDIDTELIVYNKATKTSLKDMMAKFNLGDTITTYRTDNGTLDYGTVKTDTLTLPVTVKSADWTNQLGLSSPTVIRDGIKISESDVQINDVVYYSKQLNMAWAYSKKVTGIYEDATPNKDNLTSIKLSGNTFTVEGIDAFNKLSSNGSVSYGDTITVLLGKSGNIVDVITADEASVSSTVGFLIEAGRKEFTNTDYTKYTSYYVSLLDSNGNTTEYTTDKDYSILKNSMVSLSFKTKAVKAVSTSALTGTVESSSINGMTFSTSLKIIDIYLVGSNLSTNNQTGLYCTVFPKRIEGLSLKSGDVLYYEKNSNNQITALYLNNITGDMIKYGIITSVNKGRNSNTYDYLVDGSEGNVNGIFTSIVSGQVAKFEMLNNKPDLVLPINKLEGSIKNVSSGYLETSDNKMYTLSDNLSVYLKEDYTYKYLLISKNDIIGSTAYKFTAYYDKAETSGGRIRVIIAEKKS